MKEILFNIKQLENIYRAGVCNANMPYKNYSDLEAYLKTRNRKDEWKKLEKLSNSTYYISKTIQCWRAQSKSNDLDLFIEFQYLLDNLYNSKPKLLDVGAGFGNIMYIADRMGFDSWGLEYDKNCINYFLTDTKKCINTNALLFKDYNQYDVIYLYMPIKESKKMLELLYIIYNQIDAGKTIIFHEYNFNFLEEFNKLSFDVYINNIYPHIYVKR